ncbi:hypothetical protein MK805_08090 [Shimazuella sp. AN120528]|uniref:hypothetical protein n=1 Tax=Shimazuella soli TaxID=1892854 RepID=UPI001F0EFD9C|nr:hypothetical protein [Shimazuella soli]MCH5584932.1 hypothetical protein [Shimazuella soli]
MVYETQEVTFTKRRILKSWEKEYRSLQYLTPLAKNKFDFITLGFQMIGRMKPLLELGYHEDFPSKRPHMANMIEWMKKNGWNDMALEFREFFDQVEEYMNEAHQA